jgi:dTDP-D-glucose 4,6-dehydratase
VGRPGETYNIRGGTELTNKELTEKLLEATGNDWDLVERVTDRLGHDLRYSVAITNIRNELGYERAVPSEQGLTDTVEWFRTRRDWWDPSSSAPPSRAADRRADHPTPLGSEGQRRVSRPLPIAQKDAIRVV